MTPSFGNLPKKRVDPRTGFILGHPIKVHYPRQVDTVLEWLGTRFGRSWPGELPSPILGKEGEFNG